MKIGMIAVLLCFLAPAGASAQDIQETPLEVFDPALDEFGQPIIIITDSQKMKFITDTVHKLSSGAASTQGLQGPEMVNPKEIEALIHREGPDAIRNYHAAVRTMMRDNVEWSKYNAMLLTINEIKMLSRHMTWEAMRSYLVSLDRYSEENFPIWTKMRVESWLVQAESMLVLRPDSKEKTRAIEGLVAKVILAQKTSEELEYDFNISDRIIAIKSGKVPDMSRLALAANEVEQEQKSNSKKGFFGNLTKKLKFW